MQINDIRPLYRYEEENNSITITPIQRNEGDAIYSYRLVADDGYELYYEGENQHTTVIDVKDTEKWSQEVADILNEGDFGIETIPIT